MNRDTMNSDSLLARQSLLESMARLLFATDSEESLCVSLHCTILKHGLTLAKAVARLEALGPDRSRKDKKCVTLTAVINACASFQEAKDSLNSVVKRHEAVVFQKQQDAATAAAVDRAAAATATDHELETAEAAKDAEAEEAEAEDEDALLCTAMVAFEDAGGEDRTAPTEQEQEPLVGTKTMTMTMFEKMEEAQSELFMLDSFTSFEPLLSSHVLLDTMSAHCVARTEPLKAAAKPLLTVVQKVALDNSWKAAFNREHTVEDILKQGVRTLLKLDVKGQALKLLVEKLHEEW